MNLLSVENLTLSFGGVVALSEVSLDVPKAQIVGIIGPNGAGKTTLLNAICGIQQASHGRARIGEPGVTERASRELRCMYPSCESIGPSPADASPALQTAAAADVVRASCRFTVS